MNITNKNVKTYTQNTDVMSKIADFTVPKNRVLVVSQDKSLRLYLPVVETFEDVSESGTQTLDLSAGIINAKSTNYVAESTATITNESIDYDDNELSLELDEEADVTVTYIPQSGNVEIFAEAPAGISNQRKTKIYGNDLELIHSFDQRERAITPARDYVLVEDFKVSLNVDTDLKVDLSSSLAELLIPGIDKSLDGYQQRISEKHPEILERTDLKKAIINSWV